MKSGYAICDLDEIHRDIEQSLQHIPSKAIEIQKEGNSWDVKTLKRVVKNYDFVSVHAPTRHTDLTSNDPMGLAYSRQRTMDAMTLADHIKADLFVLHPLHHEGWIEPRDRMHRRTLFMESFEHFLLPHYLNNFHEYKIAIENIEYSKYPATLEETEELHATLSSIHPVGIVVDIAHAWNSRKILSENDHLQDMIHGYPRTPEILFEYLEKFIKHNKQHIEMYHVANFGDNPVRTHDPISKDTINPDLKRLIPLIKEKPIILEIYRQNHSVLRNSLIALEEIANEHEH